MANFLSAPKTYHWMNSEDANFLKDMHKALVPFLSSHKLFKGKEIKLGYFPDIGESSYIVVIQAGDKKFVFKSARDPNLISIEAAILAEWNRREIKTPHIWEKGLISDHPYLLMDYIDEPLIGDFSVNSLLEKSFIQEMGHTLRKMSQVTGVGYGKTTDSIFQGAFNSFDEYIKQALAQNENLNYLEDQRYLDLLWRKKLTRAVDIISQDILENKVQSVVCHMDFSIYNTFATHPITVFDPGDARLNHPYIDLAQSLLIFFNLSNDITLLRSEFLKGYLESDEVINESVLNACLYIQGVKKLNTWVKKGRFVKAKILKEFILGIKI